MKTKARDKAFVRHKSDSTMKGVVAYFEKHGTPNERLESYYYMGSVYRDLHDSPKAVVWYRRGIDYGEENLEKVSHKVLANTYSQLSRIFRLQSNCSMLLWACKKEYRLGIKTNNYRFIADLAYAYKENSFYDSATIFYILDFHRFDTTD